MRSSINVLLTGLSIIDLLLLIAVRCSVAFLVFGFHVSLADYSDICSACTEHGVLFKAH